MYKVLLISFFLSTLFILWPMEGYGQNPHELIIEPGGFINETVAGDTTPSGDRLDPDRIYVLRRNTPYFVNTAIRNNNFDVRMKAEDGSGLRPVIFMVMNTSTSTFPGEIFRVTGGDLWLKDLIMVGFLESDPNEITHIPAGLIRVDGAGYDIEIQGCMLTQTRGQHIRTEGACRVIKITDCVFGNMGDLGLSNLGAGKAIDIRGTSCDTLLFINNTFVNFQDRIVRHRASTGAINHFIFDHNTLINGLSFHGTLVLGWVGKDVKITNNLFIDTFVCGNDTDATRQAEFEEHGELDEYGFPAMRWIFSVPNDSTIWQVSNNYYSVSTAVQNFYTAHAPEGVTGEGDPLTHHIKSKLGADSLSAFVKENITLGNIPVVMVNMAEWYRDPVWGANKTKSTTNFVRDRDDYDRRGWFYFEDTLDATYPNTTAAYTGSQGGFPVGDLNWYPTQKALWEQWLTGIDDPPNTIPVSLQLEQNYPNPFNPSTIIGFKLPTAGKITLDVYNITGQKVATLIDKEMIAGEHKINWDAKGLAAGVYFYRLSFNDQIGLTRKMVLLK